ncbi:hypothetical protein PIB30_019375 [Stylosanthes scabra]|uniref:Uncharacterized protein n=1 Tax=Stylosanthes scabra TaxID=79078 RepID=A0ABU6YA64_9FABA|nr:hypothetical protein [Stylosanthes scabra]
MQHAVREDNRTSRIRFKSKGILTGGGFRRPVAENRTTATEQSSPATVSPLNAGRARFKDNRDGSTTEKIERRRQNRSGETAVAAELHQRISLSLRSSLAVPFTHSLSFPKPAAAVMGATGAISFFSFQICLCGL